MIRALSQKVEALKLTQEQMAQILQIDQANVSRLEKRADLMLSTLRKYVAAMGASCGWWLSFLSAHLLVWFAFQTFAKQRKIPHSASFVLSTSFT